MAAAWQESMACEKDLSTVSVRVSSHLTLSSKWDGSPDCSSCANLHHHPCHKPDKASLIAAVGQHMVADVLFVVTRHWKCRVLPVLSGGCQPCNCFQASVGSMRADSKSCVHMKRSTQMCPHIKTGRMSNPLM